MPEKTDEIDELEAEEVAMIHGDPSRAGIAFTVIFAGGFLGSVLREVTTPLMPGPWPWLATLVINVVACLLIGLLYGHRDRVHHTFFHFGAIGFCGGLSTFSAFVHEVDTAWGTAGAAAASAPVIGSVVLGIAAAAWGEHLARRSNGR